MADPGIPQEEMISMVREILDGEDLSKITLKIVRERVLQSMGDRRDKVDMAIFKPSVKSALSTVLESPDFNTARATPTTNPQADKDGKKPTASNKSAKDEDGKENVTKSVKSHPPVRKAARIKRKVVDSDDDGSVSDYSGNADGDDEYEASDNSDAGASSKKKGKNADDDFVDEDGEDLATNSRPKVKKRRISGDNIINKNKAAKKRSRVSPVQKTDKKETDHDDVSKDSADESDSDGEQEKSTEGASRKPASRTKRPSKQSSSSRLDKLKAVYRDLGLRAPFMKLGGKTDEQKFDYLTEFLSTKGVKSNDPLTLSKHDLRKHRERLEREKDMVGIDVGFVTP